MEDIAPIHHFILIFNEELASSQPINRIIKNYIRSYRTRFTPMLIAWFSSCERGEEALWLKQQMKMTEYQRALFDLMNYAQTGGSILLLSESLEFEIRQASQLQIDDHLNKLPFKLMIPLLLFQFPALLLLILGPLLIHLINEVQ